MNKMHWGRKAVIGLGVVFLALGGKFLLDAKRWNRQYAQWEKAEPVRLNLNLREPGRYEAPFRQTCSCSHAQALECVLGEDGTLTGLRGGLVVRDLDGKEVLREAIAADDFSVFDRRPAMGMDVLPEGDYRMEVTITEGATGLTTTNHALVGRYLLCGLERRPAIIAKIIGWILIFLATICAVITFRYFMRRRRPA
jgi:hypothetical protein